jgi:hypothetical protein
LKLLSKPWATLPLDLAWRSTTVTKQRPCLSKWLCQSLAGSSLTSTWPSVMPGNWVLMACAVTGSVGRSGTSFTCAGSFTV